MKPKGKVVGTSDSWPVGQKQGYNNNWGLKSVFRGEGCNFVGLSP